MTSAPHPDAGSRAVYRAVSRLISRPTQCGISHQIPCTSRTASRAGSRLNFCATFCAHSTYLGVFQVIFANKQRICATSCRRAPPSASPIFRHFPTKKAPAKGACPGYGETTEKAGTRERNTGRHRRVPHPAYQGHGDTARHYRGSKQKSRYKCPILRRAAISTSRKAAASHRRNVRCADRGGKRLSSPPRTPRCRRRPAGTSCPRRRRARWRSPPRDFGRRWRWRHGGQGMRCRSV